LPGYYTAEAAVSQNYRRFGAKAGGLRSSRYLNQLEEPHPFRIKTGDQTNQALFRSTGRAMGIMC